MNELLTKAAWSAKDLLNYCGKTNLPISPKKAYRIIQVARDRYGGETLLKKTWAKRDSVLAVLGTTAEREMELWRKSQSDSSQKTSG